MIRRLREAVPLLVVLAAIFVLGYPVAFLAGYPLAKTNLEDRNRWFQRVIEALPPLDISDPANLRFPPLDPQRGLLVQGNVPLEAGCPRSAAESACAFRIEGDRVHFLDPEVVHALELVPLAGVIDGENRVFRLEEPAPRAALYLDGRLLRPGYEKPPEKPDGQRRRFSFSSEEGVFILRGQVLRPEEDYVLEGTTLVLRRPVPLWLSLRTEPDWARPLRITGDYAWADELTLVLREPPPAGSRLELAGRIVRWAERLQGSSDGRNRTFSLAHPRLVPNDADRELFVGSRPLSPQGRRPRERADGTRRRFTFPQAGGLFLLDGRRLEPGRDYTQEGPTVTLSAPPPRGSQLLQFDYLIEDAETSRLLLAEPPPPQVPVWAARYAVYDRPKCGENVFECFLNLPQHPVPLPHWIFTLAPAFFTRYELESDRNVLRQVLYTVQGTLVALLAGGAVGLVLAVLFVLVRPLERAFLPWVIASQTVPIIALVPMLALILSNFGVRIQTSLLPTAIIGGYLSFFPITVGTAKGLRSVDPLMLDLMRSYAARQHHVFFKLRLFAALPFIFASFKVGAAASLVGALIAETETSNAKGLGFAILGQVQAGNVADLWILFLISSLMGILFVSAVGWLERLLAPWVRRA